MLYCIKKKLKVWFQQVCLLKFDLPWHWGIAPISGGQEILTCRRKGRQVLFASLFGKQNTLKTNRTLWGSYNSISEKLKEGCRHSFPAPELSGPPTMLPVQRGPRPLLLERWGWDSVFSQKITLREQRVPGRSLFLVMHVSSGSCYFQGFLDTDFSYIKSYLHKNTIWHPAPTFIGRKWVIRFQ